MRKIYSFLMLAFAFFAGMTTVGAQNRYAPAGGFQGGAEWTADMIDPELPCILTNGNLGVVDAIQGTGKSKYLTDENIFFFEPTGETDSEDYALYRLKRKSGEYLMKGTNNAFEYTTSQARAWTFKVKDAIQYASADEMNVEGTDYTSATLSNANVNTVILSDKGMLSTSLKAARMQLLGNSEGKSAYFGSGDNDNVWLVYEAEQLLGADYIYDALAEILPNGAAELYNVGDQPGQISQALYDELVNAYDAANQLAENDPSSLEECIAAIDRCRAAIQAAKDGAVKVKEGYYYFRGNRGEYNATYDDGEGLRWTYQEEWIEPEVATAADAKYIWKLIADKENEGAYFIQNYFTKNYVGVAMERNVAIPVTTEPEESYLIYPRTKNDFVIESTTLIKNPALGWNGEILTALHQMGDGNKIVVWTNTADPSGWRFFSVDQSQIDAIDADIVQYKLKETMKALISEAEASYKRGFTYKSNATRDCLYETEGLLKMNGEVAPVFSNALELSEGSYSALFDDDVTTFFHSRWSGETLDTAYHYLACDLGTAVQNVQIKMTKRFGGQSPKNNHPTLVAVYACNDTTSLADPDWTYIADFEPTWNIAQVFAAAEEGGQATEVANAVGMLDIIMPAAYRYVRFDVKKTGTHSGLGIFFNLGTLQAYASEYDTEHSIIEAVPAAERKALEDALAAAKDEIENDYVEQATIEKLQAAYDAFMAVYPDPTVLDDLVAEAEGQAEAAAEGDALGYFKAGAKAALQAVVTEQKAKIKPVMPLEDINAVKKALEDALATFNAALIKPVNGAVYYIQSGTETTQADSATNAYLYAAGNSQRVKWAHDTQSDKAARLSMRWKAIEKDGGYMFQNMMTGEYMNNPHVNNSAVMMSTQGDTCVINLRSAKVPGLFNLVMTDNVFANAQPASGNLVTWNSASGADNSAFRLTEAEAWTGYSLKWPVAQGLQIITLPVDVSVMASEGAYSVLGVNGSNVELAEIEGEIKAGTPFFFNNTDETMSEFTFYSPVANIESLVWATEGANQNGLQGTLAATQVPHDYGRLLEGMIVHTTQNEDIAANSGYIAPGMPETTESGVMQLPIEGGVIDGIATIIAGAANSDVYTIAGVKVRSNVKGADAVKGLPAGLYIINGKKVLVK